MTQPEYRKPIPVPVPETEFFWRKAKEHELWIQRCVHCVDAVLLSKAQVSADQAACPTRSSGSRLRGAGRCTRT